MTTLPLELVYVPPTDATPFQFGRPGQRRPIHLRGFWIARYPTTQALWTAVVGTRPADHQGPDLPVEMVSWDELLRPGGFLTLLNAHAAAQTLARSVAGPVTCTFRLPSETEWEYAARGGPHWREDLPYPGAQDVDAVAWYQNNSGNQTHPVGQKAPNQLGLHDMSGNVWEWCEDTFVRDQTQLPPDGRPFRGPGEERSLRGGCFHNGALHVTPTWRYAIGHQYGDPYIGFRIVLAPVAA